MPTRRIGRRLFVLAFVVYLFTAGGSLTTTDAVATYEVTRAIVDRGEVAMSGNLLGQERERGVDGRYYAPFGIGQSIYNIPFYAGARAFVAATGLRLGKADSLLKAAVALGNTVLAAAIVWEFFQFAVLVIGELGAATLAALTLAFGSVLWPYSGFGFNQPLACLALLGATRQAFAGARRSSPRHVVHAGGWLAIALLTRHELILAPVPLAAWLWFDGRRPLTDRVRRVGALAIGPAAGVLVWMAYNAVRFGSVFNAGQDAGPGYGSPFIAGLIGLIASPAASIFLYSPFAIFGLPGLVVSGRMRDRSAAVLCLLQILWLLCFYANLGNWLAGRSYGSRYLLIVLPYFAVGYAAFLARRPARVRARLAALVLAVGVIVQVPGVLVDYAKVSQAVGAVRTPFTTEERQSLWDAAPLVLNTRALVRALPDNVAYVLGRRSPPPIASAGGEGDRGFSQQFSFSFDLWWLYLFYLGALPRVGVLAVLLAFAAAIVWLAGRLRAALA